MTGAARRPDAPEEDTVRASDHASARDAGDAACDAGAAALIDALPDAVWLVDADTLRVRAANAAAARLLGVAADELRGRSMSDLSASPEDLCFWSEVASGLSDRISSDTLVQRTDGSVLPVTRSVCRVAQPGGAGYYVVSLHDRSVEARVAQESESALAGLRATLESTADGILVTDLAGRVVACNQRFAALWGLDAELLARCDDAALRDWMQRNVADPAAYVERLAAIEIGRAHV